MNVVSFNNSNDKQQPAQPKRPLTDKARQQRAMDEAKKYRKGRK